MINVDELVERSYKTLYFWKHADYKDLLHWKSLEMYYKHQYFNSYLLKLKLNFNYFRKESVLQNPPCSIQGFPVLFSVYRGE